MSSQRSPVLQGIAGILLALGVVGGLSILGGGSLVSLTASDGAPDVAPGFEAPQAEPLAPLPRDEAPIAPKLEAEPQLPQAERAADLEMPADGIEEDLGEGVAAPANEADLVAEMAEIQAAPVELADEPGIRGRQDLTSIFSILILSVGVGIAVMLGMILVQRRS